MNSKVLLLGISFTCGTRVSCGPSAPEGSMVADQPAEHPSTTIDPARWKAHVETTAGVLGMIAQANGLSGVDVRDPLDAHMALILERCTMDGKVHETRHDHQFPPMEMIKRIPGQAATEQLDSLRIHLDQCDHKFR